MGGRGVGGSEVAAVDEAGERRRAELAANLAAVHSRIGAACLAASRDPSEVRLVVITKTYPAADVVRLASLGVADIGENRDQEAAGKAAAVARALAAQPRSVVSPRWHFVGQLQRNKCRSVVRYADLVHTVDSVRLAEALDRAERDRAERRVGTAVTPAADPTRSIEDHKLWKSEAPSGAVDVHDLESRTSGRASGESEPGLAVLVQVSLDGDPTRGGAVMDSDDPDTALQRVLAAVAAAEGLRLRGLMAVAPLGWDADRAYALLAGVAERVRAEHPTATILSAGMSGDFEQAIRHGATHVRLGTAVLGERPPLR